MGYFGKKNMQEVWGHGVYRGIKNVKCELNKKEIPAVKHDLNPPSHHPPPPRMFGFFLDQPNVRNKKMNDLVFVLEFLRLYRGSGSVGCAILRYTIQQFTIQQCIIHVYINYISFFACYH